MGNTGKRSSKRPKRSSLRAIYALLGLALLIAVSGPIIYSFLSRDTGQAPLIYETYPSGRLEQVVKTLDKEIFDALMALQIPAKDIDFTQVKTIHSGTEQWVFSELTIHTQEKLPHEEKVAAFSARLRNMTPQPDMRVRVKSDHQTLIDISLDEHPTHRIVFIPYIKKPQPIPETQTRPKIAIIIDDMGYDLEVARHFLSMDPGLSFSILPHSPFQHEIATLAHQKGRDVLLHLPMEPAEYPEVDPGPGALVTSMTPDELLDTLKRNLKAVPHISGVNNHMGSKLTENSARIRQIFTILKQQDLFFVDSLTSPKSQCARVAQLFKLPFAQRHVFLDHFQEPNAIRFQIKRLISKARKQGQAIGIGHPYPVTLQVLAEEIPEIRREVYIVPVSSLTTS